mmetsp:Transcript_41326/g.88013  ORF Transcript_41326/g.88013 Transcript_41326/m.88013 type:complete len:1005 (+) Transcript_41326:194-3208(+)
MALGRMLLALCLLGFAPTAAVRLRRAKGDGVVRKPLTDVREYVHKTFESGLRVLVVSDPEAEKSSFAVAVEAGSLEDPAEFQGLAHFTEHMLFLGSKKYPDKDDFSKHLARYGGTHNAYTAAEETVYFNEIGNDGLDKGLDIFAQFFISPSFRDDMVDKEIHAVDSEHKKNQPDTQRRLWHLLRSKANPKNPMHQFSTGDLKTLKLQPESKGLSLEDALRSFHSENYCASRLHFVLVSNLTTDEELALAHRHFDGLPVAASCPPRPVYTGEVAYSKELKNLGRLFTVGTTGAPEMWLLFPMPSLKEHYKELAEAYLWNALGHYGAGGLKELLAQEDLSHSFSYYSENSVAGSVIFVTFALTEKGSKNTDTILEYFFAYLHAIRTKGVDRKLLSSLQKMRRVEFDYQEKRASEFDFVSALAGSLPQYPPEDLLTGGVLIDRPDEELITSVLAAMAPENMNVAMVSVAFNESMASSHEPYYDFGYDEQPLDLELLERLANSSGHGLAPPPNLAYVPTRLDLDKEAARGEFSEEGSTPERLTRPHGHSEVWWLGLGGLRLPKATIMVRLGFPAVAVSRAEGVVLAAMHVRLVQLALEAPSDPLQMCGLSYSISSHDDGMAISFSGFDQHLLELMKMVLPRVREPANPEGEFEATRRQLILDLSDVTKLQPYQHALEAFEVVTVKGRFSRTELRRAALSTELVNPAAHRHFLDEVFAGASLSLLVAGNMGRARSAEAADLVEAALAVTGGEAEAKDDDHVQVIEPKEELEVRIPNPIPGDPNSATLAVYQFGVPTLTDRVHLSMLSEFMDRPIFESLRTEHQLGYVVSGYVAPHGSICEVRVVVQGFREAPDTVEDLMEATLQNLTAQLARMGQEEFEERRRSLRAALTRRPSTLAQLAGEHWGQIWDQTYCFRRRAVELSYLDSEAFDSPAPLLDAWKRAVVATPGEHRKKVAVKLFGAGAVPGNEVIFAAPAPAGEGPKVITLVDSVVINKKLKGEGYWPTEYICK